MASDAAETETATPSVALADLIASMSRALGGFAKLSDLRDAQLGLSEFVVLVELTKAVGATNGKLAKKIGVSAQRMNQVVSELRKAGLIEVSTDPEDSRKRCIELTSLGRERTRKLMEVLAERTNAELALDTAIIQSTSRRVARIARALAQSMELA